MYSRYYGRKRHKWVSQGLQATPRIPMWAVPNSASVEAVSVGLEMRGVRPGPRFMGG